MNSSLNKPYSKASFSWLFKMAVRDAKASVKKLLLFVASIVLGIAAVVAIQSFGQTLKDNIALQSKSLMGADFKIDSNSPPNEKVLYLMDSLGGPDAKEISFSSMVLFSNTQATKLVQVRGIEGGFPFYGSLETVPVSAAADYQTLGGALVDATLMMQFQVKPGDSIKIGAITLPITGSLTSVPGSNAIFSSLAPPVIIPYGYIEQTGLVQTGSRIRYDYYFQNPQADLQVLNTTVGPLMDAEDADLDTHTSTSQRLGRRYDNFGKFLNLVAFIALLLGCVGIASSIHIYIQEKLKAVAVLKCLGATKRQTFLIYLIQIAGIGFIGGIAGSVLGIVLQQLFPMLLGDLLPVDIVMQISPKIILMGISLGVFMSVLFALYPLMNTLFVSPLQALRIQEEGPVKSRKWGILVLLLVFVFIFLFSFVLLDNWQYSIVFVLSVIVIFCILAGVGNLFMKGIKKFFPKNWSFVARQSLLNLYRPQNQTLILILTIGVGTFLISTLYFTKDVLLAQASMDASTNSTNIILLDVQTDQVASITTTLSAMDMPVNESMPIITMRLHSIEDIPVNEIRQDSTSKIRRWILNHEFRVSYRETLSDSEVLAEGEWYNEIEAGDQVFISISDNFAEDANVDVGDKIIFNVQGVLLSTIVGSIRTVDWSNMQMNFSIIFPKGVLEDAPQFSVITTRVPDESTSALLQQELVRDMPNISIIDLRQVLTVVEKLLDKISLLINFMAFFSILTGFIVLIGAVRTSKFQRIKESVLLRTLGATGSQVLKITVLEYLYLGVLGALSGILLSFVMSQAIAIFFFNTAFVPSLLPFLVLFPGIALLVPAIGLWNNSGVIHTPPLEVLRKENL